jgi:hypothetical protein
MWMKRLAASFRGQSFWSLFASWLMQTFFHPFFWLRSQKDVRAAFMSCSSVARRDNNWHNCPMAFLKEEHILHSKLLCLLRIIACCFDSVFTHPPKEIESQQDQIPHRIVLGCCRCEQAKGAQ